MEQIIAVWIWVKSLNCDLHLVMTNVAWQPCQLLFSSVTELYLDNGFSLFDDNLLTKSKLIGHY